MGARKGFLEAGHPARTAKVPIRPQRSQMKRDEIITVEERMEMRAKKRKAVEEKVENIDRENEMNVQQQNKGDQDALSQEEATEENEEDVCYGSKFEI